MNYSWLFRFKALKYLWRRTVKCTWIMDEYKESTGTFLGLGHLSLLRNYISHDLINRSNMNLTIQFKKRPMSKSNHFYYTFFKEREFSQVDCVNSSLEGSEFRAQEEEKHLLSAVVQAVWVLESHHCILRPAISLQRCLNSPTCYSWTWEGTVKLWHVYCRSCQCCWLQQMSCMD